LRSGKSNTNGHSDRNRYIVAVFVTHTYTDANPMLRQVYANTATSSHPSASPVASLMRKTRTAQFAFLNPCASTFFVLFFAISVPAYVTTITVTNTNDRGPGLLRQALASANDADTINFSVTGTIALTSGGLMIDKNVTISGPGANQLSIDGNQADFVFGVDRDTTAAITGLTITNGEGGIRNIGTLTVSNCTISGNSSGGLSNVANGQASTRATLTIANSTISDNSGPGIFNASFRASASNYPQ
jgi:hypothetical protein